MKKLLTGLALALAVCAGLFSFNRIDYGFLEMLKTKLNTYNSTYTDERVYLQFDKTLYKPGEDIWYKAYVLSGPDRMPTQVSTVVYVELVDPKGSVVKRSDLLVETGVAHGDFLLEADAVGGLYTVRAFTRWMQNFSGEGFFTKQVPVQSIITPRLLLKIDFEKKAYGNNDKVLADLKARNLRDQPIRNAEVKAKLRLNGKEFQAASFKTNDKGEARIEFTLPNHLTSTDGLLEAIVSAAGIDESISRSVPIVLNQIQLSFFPEGGEIVAGSNGKVAFKATNEFGKGADVEGTVYDEFGKVVSSFSSFHFGMGSFDLPSKPGTKYFARITRPSGIRDTFHLPAIMDEGHALSISTSPDSIHARVFSPGKTEAFLIGHVNGLPHHAAKLELSAGWNMKSFSSKTMPAGIAVFTLFDINGQEVGERLVFVRKDNLMRVEMKTDRSEYGPREKVELTVRTSDEKGDPVPANISLSVVDDQLLTAADDKQHNILSWMLFGSDLKGKIEEPFFYFDESQAKANAALDLVMMVHGWRRFTWKEVLGPPSPLAHLPEKDSDITGLVLNKDGIGTKAEVILLELNSRRRIAKVKTGTTGQFLFRNVDPSANMALITRKPNVVEVNGVRPMINEIPGRSERPEFVDMRRPTIEIGEVKSKNAEVNRKDAVAPAAPNEGFEVNVDLSSDVTQLSEVVVTGWGAEDKHAMSGSVVTLRHTDFDFTTNSIESLLQGRVAGVSITQNVQPGAGTNLVMRGVSTLSNRSEPLWVIDGIPMEESANSNFTTGAQLTQANVSSIHVLQAPEATAQFGDRAANGAILVETKDKAGNGFSYQPAKAKYSVLELHPRQFTMAREFYQESYVIGSDSRTTSNTTVLWKHTVITDRDGTATINFNTSDALSTFRITAEGISGRGLVGRSESTYHSLLPFAVDSRVPSYLGFEDTLRIPVTITNNTRSKLSAKVHVTLPVGLKLLDNLPPTVNVMEGQATTLLVPIAPTGKAGTFPMSISIDGGGYEDQISKDIIVRPVGFQVRASYSGKELSKEFKLPITHLEAGSIQGELVFVTDLVRDLFTTGEAMLREPHGCFEQVSSTTFPNILVLQLMRETGQSNSHIEDKAQKLISKGYKMLAGYEVRGGGFEWFGHTPAHIGLTAFGILEFAEMQKVYPHVDQQMVDRTKEWLLSKRRHDGTFEQGRGLDSFYEVATDITSAYVTYALSETGVLGLETEYRRGLAKAKGSQDMYLSALMANIAINYNRISDYQDLKNAFADAMKSSGIKNLKTSQSMTYSRGISLSVETVALWALALMKESRPDLRLVKECVDHLVANKSFGMYGSTQATYLAIKVLVAYDQLMRSGRSNGSIVVSVGDFQETDSFTRSSNDDVRFTKFADHLKEGNNSISFKYVAGGALPSYLNISWNTKTPASSSDCPLLIETRLATPVTNRNETVRLSIKLSNTSASSVPMSMGLVGIPAGLSLQPWQLKELTEKGVFDFYEIIGDKLAIYYRELGPHEKKEINVDLKADVPGSFLATASCAYLYYTAEHKNWVKGTSIRIQ